MLKTFFITIFTVIITTGIAISQTTVTTSSTSPTNAGKSEPHFVSINGGFIIDLPTRLSSYSPNERVEGVIIGGSKYIWNLPQGFFMVSFYEYASVPENPKAQLERIGGALIDSVTSTDGALISKKEISIDGNTGLEIRMRLKNGTIGIARYYSVKNLTFFLSSGWNDSDNGEPQLKILDSFKLIDRQTAIAKKVEQATPDSLPQAPVIKRVSSDIKEDCLKGKVKTVVEETENLSADLTTPNKHLSFIVDYNENGDQLKEIYYEGDGRPYSITIYGYIDGMRVSNSGYINYEDNGQIMVKTPVSPNQPQKPADKRYQTQYEYKYENGKLTEVQLFRNNGLKGILYVYKYDGNQKEEIRYTPDGKINQKYITVFDEKGNETEWANFDILEPKVYGDAKYSIKTESYDKKGNWTKRTFSKLVTENGKEVYKPNFTKYRTITYYP